MLRSFHAMVVASLAADRGIPNYPETPGIYRWTVFPALCLIALAGLMFLFGGYHAGFETWNAIGPALPASFWSVLSALGDTAVALALFLFILPGRWGLAWIAVLATVSGLIFTHGFKQFFPLLRPSGFLPPDSFFSVGLLKPDQSFPSGHSQTALTLTAMALLAFPHPLARSVIFGTGLIVALSRVPVGMHWPIDVLIGAAGGLLCAALAIKLAHRVPLGLSPAVVYTMIALGLASAFLMVTGHPSDYPAARPVVVPLGMLTLVWFVLSSKAHLSRTRP